MIPFITDENGEAVIRGVNIIWFTMMVQGVAYLGLALYILSDYIKKRRQRKTRITLTMSNGEFNGDYEKVG